MRVKENECKEKRRYGCCASKEKNIDATLEVIGEPGHDGVHHHTQIIAFSQRCKHDLDPPRRRVPLLRDG